MLSEEAAAHEEVAVESWFAKDGPVETRILRRSDLSVDSEGPAIVYGDDATTLIPPGTQGRIDQYANMILEIS
jgi:N-methylhydantoinase A/oxoprolinase/acetone carboxylase beta subunit